MLRLCPSLLCLLPCPGESPAAKLPCLNGVCSPRGCCSCPGWPWLRPVPRAQQVSWGVLWQDFVLQGENAMRNRVHRVIAQTCGGFFIKVVLGQWGCNREPPAVSCPAWSLITALSAALSWLLLKPSKPRPVELRPQYHNQK